MARNSKILFVLAISASLALAGCVDAIDERIGTSSLDGEDNVAILVTVENAPDNFSHLGFAVDQVFLHEADTPQPDGYFELNAKSQADLIVAGTGNTVKLANGSVPAGTYDQVLFKLEAVQNHPGTGEEPHEHEDGADDHEHDHGSQDTKQVGGTTGPQDLAVNISATLEMDELTEIELVLDGTASTESGTFQPVFTKLVLRQDGELVSESTGVQAQLFGEGSTNQGPTTSPSTPPPVARMTVFAPSGDKAYEPAFQAEDGDFVNSLSSAYKTGEEIRFNAIESEAVAPGASLESFAWDFGDGTTATGTNAVFTYGSSGVFEVALTVTDSNDVSDTHVTRVVVADWSQVMTETSFEDGPADWTTSTDSLTEVGPSEGLTTWELHGPGFESETSWHAGLHELDGTPVSYEPLTTVTLTSAEYTIPEDYLQAGYFVHINGSASQDNTLCTPAELTVTYTVDGEDTTDVGAFTNTDGWIQLGGQTELNEHVGKTVVFEFEFYSSCQLPLGAGFYVDAFQLGGLAESDFTNAHLLDEASGGHDGHDHEH